QEDAAERPQAAIPGPQLPFRNLQPEVYPVERGDRIVAACLFARRYLQPPHISLQAGDQYCDLAAGYLRLSLILKLYPEFIQRVEPFVQANRLNGVGSFRHG